MCVIVYQIAKQCNYILSIASACHNVCNIYTTRIIIHQQRGKGVARGVIWGVVCCVSREWFGVCSRAWPGSDLGRGLVCVKGVVWSVLTSVAKA